jgi:hypothetical protein
LSSPSGDFFKELAMWNISASARRNLLLISALALCSLPMYGRTGNTGTIAVSVSDPSGAPVAGAAVAIHSESTQEERDLTTDAEGNFSVPFLSPGNYDLTGVLGIFQQSEAADDRVAPLECSRAAQDHGTLSGTVSDVSGSEISGALITASCGSFRQAVTTDLIGVRKHAGNSRSQVRQNKIRQNCQIASTRSQFQAPRQSAMLCQRESMSPRSRFDWLQDGDEVEIDGAAGIERRCCEAEFRGRLADQNLNMPATPSTSWLLFFAIGSPYNGRLAICGFLRTEV